MNIRNAREKVVLAGRQLVESGLIARTWGNVSCRISDTQFVITPSGKSYESLTTDDIVLVNIENSNYAGELKPSSEKGIHAEVYKNRPDINFVIHTHQNNASVVSPLKTDIIVSDPVSASIIGGRVVSASYGLPGTKKLAKGVAAALAKSDGKAFLMAYHGALCLGKDYEEAFRVASELEKICENFVVSRYLALSEQNSIDYDEMRDFYVRKETCADPSSNAEQPVRLYNSEREGDYFKLYTGATEEDPFPDDKETGYTKVSLKKTFPAGSGDTISPEAQIHRAIYRKHKHINAIIHTTSPDVLAVSRAGKTICSYLDDFAQIVGRNILVAVNKSNAGSAAKIAKKLEGRNAVIIKDNGALCAGPTRLDTTASVMVMEKGCKTVIGTSFFGKIKPINPLECILMRFIYQTRYAGKAY